MSTDDDIDRRLRSDAVHWRSGTGVDPDLEQPAGSGTEGHYEWTVHPRTRVVAIAVSIVAVLGIVAGGAIWRHTTTRHTATQTPTVTRPVIGPDANGPARSTDPPTVFAKLRTIAQDNARENGDFAATADAVATTYDRADALTTGRTRPGDDVKAVWLIQIHGHFTCAACMGPAAGGITGSVITLIVDRTTFATRSFGLSDRTVSLASLGSVTRLVG